MITETGIVFNVERSIICLVPDLVRTKAGESDRPATPPAPPA